LQFGIDPWPLQVCHHCDNPPCVKGKDLFRGTGKDNMQDASRKGRMRLNDKRKQAVAEANRRRIFTDSDRQLKRLIMKRRWQNDSYRQLIVRARLGKAPTSETRKQMSISQKLAWVERRKRAS
jgi:hypothetical protein